MFIVKLRYFDEDLSLIVMVLYFKVGKGFIKLDLDIIIVLVLDLCVISLLVEYYMCSWDRIYWSEEMIVFVFLLMV